MKTLLKSLPSNIYDEEAWEEFELEMQESGIYEFAKFKKKQQLED